VHPNASLGRYDTVLDPCHIYTGGPREPFYTCRLLVLRSEEDEQPVQIENEFLLYKWNAENPSLNHHFSMSRLIDWNYDPAEISDRVRKRILTAVNQVRFQQYILCRVAESLASLRPVTLRSEGSLFALGLLLTNAREQTLFI
jgi:hypothetical protein